MSPVSYYTMIKSKDKGFVFGIRLQMVRYALEKGIKATARLYGVSRNTVRKWLRRYSEGGTTGIVERSRAPGHIPHKTPKEVEEEILRHRRGKPYLGARRLKRDFGIPCSCGAINRILRQNGLIGKRRKKRAKRVSLRAVKDKLRPFERNCVDTKHLKDIPNYLAQMRVLGLPGYEYTMREMRLGAAFVGYANELSISHAKIFTEVVMDWIKRHGVELSGTRCYHDGGSEFIGSWNAKVKSAFIRKLEEYGVESFQIPKVTYNADVETFHRTILVLKALELRC